MEVDLNKIDKFSGEDFEKLIAQLFKKMGYAVMQTTQSHDFGCDVLLEMDGEKTAIQTKRQKDVVNNTSIQEVVASLKFYNAKHGIVVTNNFFTKNAIELANTNNIRLINRNDLSRLLEKYDLFLESSNDFKRINNNLNPIVKDCVDVAVAEYQQTQDRKKVYDKITEVLVKNYGMLIKSSNFISHFQTIEFLLKSDHNLDLQFNEPKSESEPKSEPKSESESEPESNIDLGVLQGRPRSEVSKMQLFMDTLKSLEGDNEVPVEERVLVKELVRSGKFGEEEARRYILRMLREASIYYRKPGHYNRV